MHHDPDVTLTHDPPALAPSATLPYVWRVPVPGDTPLAACDAAVADLRAAADRWASEDPARLRDLLDEVLRATAPLIGRWTELGSIHEGVDPASREAAEEAIAGPYVVIRSIRLHRDALARIARDGRPRIPGPVRTLPDGRVGARVMPAGLVDRATYIGLTAEVRMDRGLTVEALPDSLAGAYRTPPPGRVALVLGGGNVSSIGPLDTIHKLVVDRECVVLKVHPVMAHLTDVVAAALDPFVREGVLRIVSGDAAQGAYLVATRTSTRSTSPAPTGPTTRSCSGRAPRATHAARRDEPLLDKPFTAELGNLTPIVVVPGRWSERELDFHAEHIATMLTNNAGFNCTASRVIVTAAGWPSATR